jgi:hypothetical protein
VWLIKNSQAIKYDVKYDVKHWIQCQIALSLHNTMSNDIQFNDIKFTEYECLQLHNTPNNGLLSHFSAN